MKKLLNVMHKNHEGFTLVELMIVVVIIGILVAIAIPIYGTITQSAERTAVEANLRTIDGGIMMYRAEHEDYPAETGTPEGNTDNVNDLLGDYVEDFEAAGGESYKVGQLESEATHNKHPEDTGYTDSDDRPYGYFSGEVGGIDTRDADDNHQWVRLPINWDDLE